MAVILENYIGKGFRRSESDTLIPDVNPSDVRDVIASVPAGTAADVAAAVQAAREAQPAWRRTPGPARAEYLYRWGGVIAGRREELAAALSREVGKPIAEARGEISRCEVILRYYAGEAVRPMGSLIPAQTERTLQFSRLDPVGVVGLITPWNFPVAIPLWKAAPALAFGNAVVLKPAEAASHMAVLLAETAAAAELPPGVFNIVLGTGPVVGEALVRSEGVGAVSFTGSTTAGARIAALCAERNVPCQREMGGKNVAIILADADLDRAAALTVAGAMRYAGQKCTATSRTVVDRKVRDAFLGRLEAQLASLTLGPVDDAAAAVGPLINEAARERVLGALGGIDSARVRGGGVPADERFSHGHFVAPAIVHDIDRASSLAQDELFGPVLAVFTADDLEEAITIANDTRYGLSASLFTQDLRSALEYIDRIDVGLVRVNGDTTGVDPHAPFGGTKASSSGTREQGQAARDFYTTIRTIQVHS